MRHNRRQFIATASTLAATTLLRHPLQAAEPADQAAKPLRILILGGTGFLGPACTESALARGHHVTLFNSGRTEQRRQEAGRPSVVPAGVEQLYGNRDPNKTADDRRKEGQNDSPKDPNSPKGLSQLEGKKWDGVIDTSGYFPRMVKASAELLGPNVGQYVFISTISVYKDNLRANADETMAGRRLSARRRRKPLWQGASRISGPGSLLGRGILQAVSFIGRCALPWEGRWSFPGNPVTRCNSSTFATWLIGLSTA